MDQSTGEQSTVVMMIRYQDFNFNTISIRYFENIVVSISIFLK